ncbi:Branched-chain amino acid ABC transporter permease [Hyphomicrobiales bacterium]|nr:branched-chain amino acid ABC transporter permease [Bosea sp. (in: a-proteobacteria)]CAH1696456.1 Branched-chain amino acid ABC transporter permease [Hyphomicrobiales bacterium]CAH1696461.1 Branched-chain amino acid ABC transporter permease [Hyphomicrobiales bacterium]
MTLLQRQRPTLLLVTSVLLVTLTIHNRVVWLDTSVVIAIYSLLALSVGISYGYGGILSVAQAAFASIGAYATAIVTVRYGLPSLLGLGLALILPAMVAYPLARLMSRMSPLALAIATLVFGQAVDIGLREGGDFTGGYIGLSGVPPVPFAESPLAFHALSWFAVVVVSVLLCNLTDSGFGRAVSTVRADTFRAVADGVDVARVRSTVLALSASVAGLGGWLYAHHISYIGPDSLGPSVSLSVMLMAVVGGARSVLGPILGAALLTLIFKFVPSQEVQGMFYGGALIAVLVLSPGGMLDLNRTLRANLPRLLSRRNAVAAAPAAECMAERSAL